MSRTSGLEIRGELEREYADLFTPRALDALAALAPLNPERREVMAVRIARRQERARTKQRITFLDPASIIPRTTLAVRDVREGNFTGSDIPTDLKRQWVQASSVPALHSAGPQAGNWRTAAHVSPSGAG